MSAAVGSIMKLHGLYYLVVDVRHDTPVNGDPRLIGIQITGYKRRTATRKRYTVNEGIVVAEEHVPDYVWVDLAKWRLTS